MVAKDMGLQAKLLDSVDERRQSWLLETAEAFASTAKGDWRFLVTESSYVHHLVKTVLALGVHGECVIVGRGGAFILPPATTLRVRLVGPVRERIAALARRRELSERQAARRIRTIDRERCDFVRDHFLKDPEDSGHYDLVLNALRYSATVSANIIADALHRMQSQPAALEPAVTSR
jgi:cytidylate kinase